MDYGSTLGYIHSLGNFSKKPSLERIKRVMDILGDPQNEFWSFHVAGTNGKGSVCAYISSVLSTAGIKTGLFTSPYIVDFRERIQINGNYISKEDLIRLSDLVKSTGVSLGEFEFITAVGFLYFKEQGCQVAVVETGLGGKFDATNVLERKIPVITKIGLDHTAILGDTVEKIAKEKSGIIKGNVAVSDYNQQENVYKILSDSAEKLIIPDIKQLKVLKSDLSGNSFIYKGINYKTKLIGVHQIENAVTAIEAIGQSDFMPDYETLKKGIYNAIVPARLEVIKTDPLIVIDGSHNPDAAGSFAEFLRKTNGKKTAIIGMVRDKNYDEFLKITAGYFDNIITVEIPDMPRSVTAQELLSAVKRYCSSAQSADSIADALSKAQNYGNDTYIFGSLYLAAKMREAIKE